MPPFVLQRKAETLLPIANEFNRLRAFDKARLKKTCQNIWLYQKKDIPLQTQNKK